jgi:hypothetical protein
VVPAVRLHQSRREEAAPISLVCSLVPQVTPIHACEGSPLRYRLPPPLL